jgi:hypothetical protein
VTFYKQLGVREAGPWIWRPPAILGSRTSFALEDADIVVSCLQFGSVTLGLIYYLQPTGGTDTSLEVGEAGGVHIGVGPDGSRGERRSARTCGRRCMRVPSQDDPRGACRRRRSAEGPDPPRGRFGNPALDLAPVMVFLASDAARSSRDTCLAGRGGLVGLHLGGRAALHAEHRAFGAVTVGRPSFCMAIFGFPDLGEAVIAHLGDEGGGSRQVALVATRSFSAAMSTPR